MPHPFMIPCLALAVAALTIDAGGDTGAASGRFVSRTVKTEGGTHAYSVWLPAGYSPARQWPAILFLHGSGECGDDGLKPSRVGLGAALAAQPDQWPCVVVFPQKPREDEEWEEHETLVFAVLADAERAFAIDRHRVALAGISQGGHGAWMIGARHPERFTCLVPVCGYGRARTVSPRVSRLPVWAFHGLRDDLVDPEDTRLIVAGIREHRIALGLDTTRTRMTLYPEANHNSWDPAFAEPGLAEWILSQPPTR